jgi:hypothetical protein
MPGMGILLFHRREATPFASRFSFPKEIPMLTLALIAGGTLALYALWFVFETIRYIASGEYATDKRLRDISR